jgi:hypothetical protein
MTDLEKRFVIKYFYDEHNEPKEIHDILCVHFTANTPSLKAVCYWIKEVRSGRTGRHDISSTGRTPDEGLVDIITGKHEENPGFSARRPSESLRIAPSAMRHYLRNNFISLPFQKKVRTYRLAILSAVFRFFTRPI